MPNLEETNQLLTQTLICREVSSIEKLYNQANEFLTSHRSDKATRSLFYLATAYELCEVLNSRESPYEAIKQRLYEQVRDLEDKLHANKQGETLLHYFANLGNASIFYYLFKEQPALKQSQSVNAEYGITIKKTPLHIAAENGFVGIVRTLLEQGAEITKGDNEEYAYAQTALHLAAEKGHLAVISALLEHAATRQVLVQFINRKQGGRLGGFSALHHAARKGHIEIIKKFFEAGADIMLLANQPEQTCLESAIDSADIANFEQQDEASNLLLSHWSGLVEKTLLHKLLERAVENALETTVNALLARLLNSSGQFFQPSLKLLEAAPQAACVAKLKCDLEKRDAYIRIMLKLMDYADNAKLETPLSHYEGNLLHFACQEGWTVVVEKLLEKGLAINQANRSDNLPLHLAAACSDDKLNLVKRLLEKDENSIWVKNQVGQTPLHKASEAGNVKVVFLLLAYGANTCINEQDREGNTCLHLVARAPFVNRNKTVKSYEEIIKLFLCVGANTQMLNNEGKTPLQLAREANCQSIVDHLLSNSPSNLTRQPLDKKPQFMALAQQAQVGRDLIQLVIGQLTIEQCSTIIQSNLQIDIEKLKIILIKQYSFSNNQQIKRLSGEVLPIVDYFVNLSIVKQSSQQAREKKMLKQLQADYIRLPSYETIFCPNKEELVDYKDLFTEQFQKMIDQVKPIKRILIIGRAGIGKTTLCKRIAYDRLQHMLWEDKFEWFIWLPLRNLKRYPKNKGDKPFTLENIFLWEYFQQEPKESRKHLAEQLCRLIQDKRENTLFLLDGWDEIARERNASYVKFVLEELMDMPFVIVTTRPTALPSQSFDATLENVGFSQSHVSAYLNTLLAKNSYQKEIRQFINDNPMVAGLANIPIHLDVLCYSWDVLKHEISRNPSSASLTMTKLYSAMAIKLWLQHLDRPSARAKLSQQENYREWLNNLESIEREDMEEMVKPELYFLRHLAFRGLQEGIIEFNYDVCADVARVVKSELEQGEKIKINLTTLMDFLKETTFLSSADSGPKEKMDYYFLHLTFQEYFAAQYIADCIQRNLPTQVYSNAELSEKIKIDEFVARYKHDLRYQVVWWFVAGLLSNDNDKLINYFLKIIDSPNMLSKKYANNLLIRCADEVSPFNNGLIKYKNFETYIHQIQGKEKSSKSFEILNNLLKISQNFVKNFYKFNFNIGYAGLEGINEEIENFKKAENFREKSNICDCLSNLKDPTPKEGFDVLVNFLEKIIRSDEHNEIKFYAAVGIVNYKNDIEGSPSINEILSILYAKLYFDRWEGRAVDALIKIASKGAAILEKVLALFINAHSYAKVSVLALILNNEFESKNNTDGQFINKYRVYIIKLIENIFKVDDPADGLENYWIARLLNKINEKFSETLGGLFIELIGNKRFTKEQMESYLHCCRYLGLFPKACILTVNNILENKKNDGNLRRDALSWLNTANYNEEFLIKILEDKADENFKIVTLNMFQDFSEKNIPYFRDEINDPHKRHSTIFYIYSMRRLAINFKNSILEVINQLIGEKNIDGLTDLEIFRLLSVFMEINHRGHNIIQLSAKLLEQLDINCQFDEEFNPESLANIFVFLRGIDNNFDDTVNGRLIKLLDASFNSYFTNITAEVAKALIRLNLNKDLMITTKKIIISNKIIKGPFGGGKHSASVAIKMLEHLFYTHLNFKLNIISLLKEVILETTDGTVEKIASYSIAKLDPSAAFELYCRYRKTKCLEGLIYPAFENVYPVYIGKTCLYIGNIYFNIEKIIKTVTDIENDIKLAEKNIDLENKQLQIDATPIKLIQHSISYQQHILVFKEQPVCGDGWCLLYAIGVINPEQALLRVKQHLNETAISQYLSQGLYNDLHSGELKANFAGDEKDSNEELIQLRIAQFWEACQSHEDQTLTSETPGSRNLMDYLKRPEVLKAYLAHFERDKYVNAVIASAYLALDGKRLCILQAQPSSQQGYSLLVEDGINLLTANNIVYIIFKPNAENTRLSHYDGLVLVEKRPIEQMQGLATHADNIALPVQASEGIPKQSKPKSSQAILLTRSSALFVNPNEQPIEEPKQEKDLTAIEEQLVEQAKEASRPIEEVLAEFQQREQRQFRKK